MGGTGGWDSKGKPENFNNCGLAFKLLLYFLFLAMKTTKNIFVYSKSNIKIKVTNKQNLKHFKMINRKLFTHRFCSNSKILLSSSWAIFIRALVFPFSCGLALLSRCLLMLVRVIILFFTLRKNRYSLAGKHIVFFKKCVLSF